MWRNLEQPARPCLLAAFGSPQEAELRFEVLPAAGSGHVPITPESVTAA